MTPEGGSASISNSHLFIGVPGGSNHDPLLPSNQAVRVMQTIGNEDFDVAIKIDSPLFATDENTSQGLMVLSDSQNFITFALKTDGNKSVSAPTPLPVGPRPLCLRTATSVNIRILCTCG